MKKTTAVVAIVGGAIACATVLSGCSAGPLPVQSAASPGSTSAQSQPSAAGAAASDDLTAVPKNCPTSAEVSALVGFTVAAPDPTRTSAGLACTYASSDVAHDMEINFHSAPAGTTAATVKAELANNNSEGAVITPVSGLGDAAFAGVLPKGGAALLVWNKGVEFSLVDVQGVDGLRRVALGILAD